ncbi:MAG: hypothetical protein HY856_18315 [Burkholderiales bacterium]|nr:hypothetical protein [Burkholderiales bacterium]
MATAQTALAFDDLPPAAPRLRAQPLRRAASGAACHAVAAAPLAPMVPTGAHSAEGHDHPDSPDPGFVLGWDHARHGLVPPPDCLRPGHPVEQGWLAGRAAFGRRTLRGGRHVQRWLRLRLAAWAQGEAFEELLVTPNFLAQIDTPRCPVSRQPLAADAPATPPAPASPDAPPEAGGADAEPLRLNQHAGHAAGNLAIVSAAVRAAAQGLRWDEARLNGVLAQARAAQGEAGPRGLGAAEWARLSTLMSFATPLPHEVAAALPLRALPPNRVRLINPIQGLQALVTLQLTHEGFAVRVARLASLLPGLALRRDFQLFFHTLLPRAWAGGRPASLALMRERLEDAWGQPDVLRRWQRVASQLDAAQADAIVQRAVALGLAAGLPGATRSQWHPAGQATDGWALASAGRAH